METFSLQFKGPGLEQLYQQFRLPEVLTQFKKIYFILIGTTLLFLISSLIQQIETIQILWLALSLLKSLGEILIVFKCKQELATIIISYNNVLLSGTVPYLLQIYYFKYFESLDAYIVGGLMIVIHLSLLISYKFLENLISIILVFTFLLAYSISEEKFIAYQIAIPLIAFTLIIEKYYSEKLRRNLFISIQNEKRWSKFSQIIYILGEIIDKTFTNPFMCCTFEEKYFKFVLLRYNDQAQKDFQLIQKTFSQFLRSLQVFERDQNLEELLYERLQNPEQFQEQFLFIVSLGDRKYSLRINSIYYDEQKYILVFEEITIDDKIKFLENNNFLLKAKYLKFMKFSLNTIKKIKKLMLNSRVTINKCHLKQLKFILNSDYLMIMNLMIAISKLENVCVKSINVKKLLQRIVNRFFFLSRDKIRIPMFLDLIINSDEILLQILLANCLNLIFQQSNAEKLLQISIKTEKISAISSEKFNKIRFFIQSENQDSFLRARRSSYLDSTKIPGLGKISQQILQKLGPNDILNVEQFNNSKIVFNQNYQMRFSQVLKFINIQKYFHRLTIQKLNDLLKKYLHVEQIDLIIFYQNKFIKSFKIQHLNHLTYLDKFSKQLMFSWFLFWIFKQINFLITILQTTHFNKAIQLTLFHRYFWTSNRVKILYLINQKGYYAFWYAVIDVFFNYIEI